MGCIVPTECIHTCDSPNYWDYNAKNSSRLKKSQVWIDPNLQKHSPLMLRLHVTFLSPCPLFRVLLNPIFFIVIRIRVRLHQASESTLRWHLWFCAYWIQWSHSGMELQHIFKRHWCLQWEQNRKCHCSVDTDAWFKQTLTERKWVRHPFCPLFTPSTFAQC